MEAQTLTKRGAVEAGFPTSAEEELVDTITLDEYLIGNREATYMLRVKSDALAESGILKGDTLLVERGRDPRKNDIVILELNGEYQMRHYGDIEPGSKVEAVVTAVVRKYGN